MCDCNIGFGLSVGSPDRVSYKRMKRVLDLGKHPTFIGFDMSTHHARNGGLIIFTYQNKDVGVAMMNTRVNCLLVLNVIPEHRSHGLGTAIIRYTTPTWVRAIDSAKPYFEKLGFTSVGDQKQGRRFMTQIMVKSTLLSLGGRVTRIFSPTPWNKS